MPALQDIALKREQILQSADVIDKQAHIPVMSDITQFIKAKELSIECRRTIVLTMIFMSAFGFDTPTRQPIRDQFKP